MRPFSLALALALALALSIPAVADGCVPTTSAADITVRAEVTVLYFDDVAQLSWMWIYEESNGIEGLQRQDEVHDDTCGGLIAGDTIHY